jgi:hypothetical protein
VLIILKDLDWYFFSSMNSVSFLFNPVLSVNIYFHGSINHFGVCVCVCFRFLAAECLLSD